MTTRYDAFASDLAAAEAIWQLKWRMAISDEGVSSLVNHSDGNGRALGALDLSLFTATAYGDLDRALYRLVVSIVGDEDFAARVLEHVIDHGPEDHAIENVINYLREQDAAEAKQEQRDRDLDDAWANFTEHEQAGRAVGTWDDYSEAFVAAREAARA
jgi:hypothetical protein